MRKKIAGLAIALVVSGVAFAPAAFADPGHGSCSDLFTGVLVPMAQDGGVGTVASADAPLNEIIHSYQSAYCQPRP
jgi:hypothetical protein